MEDESGSEEEENDEVSFIHFSDYLRPLHLSKMHRNQI